MTDPSTLISTLNQAKLQTDNPALHQLLKQIISILKEMQPKLLP